MQSVFFFVVALGLAAPVAPQVQRHLTLENDPRRALSTFELLFEGSVVAPDPYSCRRPR